MLQKCRTYKKLRKFNTLKSCRPMMAAKREFVNPPVQVIALRMVAVHFLGMILMV
jgi:hypothetical protein